VKGVDKDKTPLWSKKDGLYSMLPRILNCEDKFNPHKTELEEMIPDIVGTELKIDLDIEEKNNWVFYWATEPGSSLEGDKPENAAKSYGDESNHGLTKVDGDGKAVLVLNCPKLYKEEDQLFPRHVHYTILTKDEVWSTSIGTLEVICKVPFELMTEIQQKKTYIVMNALTEEAYKENHIPNSILCHHESLDGYNKQKKTGVIKRLLNESLSSFPPVKKFIKDVGDIKETPIIVYCGGETCTESTKLIEHLYSCGFFNVMEYPGGMKEWLEKSNKTKLFEDAPTDEDDEEVEESVLDADGDGDELNDDEELIIYDGVEYIHKIDGSDEILTKDDVTIVGMYIGEEIEWINSTEYEHHVKRRDEKGGLDIADAEEDAGEDAEEDAEEDVEEDEDAEEDVEEEAEAEEVVIDEESSDSDDDDDEEYNEDYLRSHTVSELKKLLDKMHERVLKKPTKKDDMINCLLSCKSVYTGGGYSDNIMYGGRVNQSMYDNHFRGWGFTFLK